MVYPALALTKWSISSGEKVSKVVHVKKENIIFSTETRKW